MLIASTAAETSSLVAMEALASGTPVIAYRAGALPDIVDDGVTGWLVDDVAGMADAIRRVDAIDPAACRAAALARFSQTRMIEDYMQHLPPARRMTDPAHHRRLRRRRNLPGDRALAPPPARERRPIRPSSPGWRPRARLRGWLSWPIRHRDQLEPLSAFARAGLDPGDDTMAGTAALFDRFAAQAPEAGVAFYSFGDPAVLSRATDELVAVIRTWAPPAGRRVVDLGCGIGRVSLALAAEAAAVTGIDVSAGMVGVAQARSGGARATFIQGDGLGLPMIADGAGDLLLAVDSWPFVVRAGRRGDRCPGGRDRARAGARWRLPRLQLVLSRRPRDRRSTDAQRARGGARLRCRARRASGPFAIWDGVGFHLRRRA